MALTVKQLIDELNKYDPDSEVLISDSASFDAKQIEYVFPTKINGVDVVEIMSVSYE